MTIKRILWALPLVFVCWIAVMAGVMRVSDAAPAAVVPFPSTGLLDSLPVDVGVLDISDASLVVANRPGLAGELYQAGAWLVLPAGLTGCLPLPNELRTKLGS